VYGPQQKNQFHTLTVRVRSSLYQTVDRIAHDRGETVSSIVRDFLRRGIEQGQDAEQRSDR